MVLRPLVLLLGAAIFGSLFLPWLNTPLGAALVPWDFITELDGTALQTAPALGIAYLASFVLAALLTLLCVVGSEHKLIAIATGALPLGLAGYAMFAAREQVVSLGLPLPEPGAFADILEQALQVFGLGAFVYLGAAALLFLISVFDPGRSDA